MVGYRFKSCQLMLSARDYLLKVSWKSEAGNVKNQVTLPNLDQLSEISRSH